MTHAEYFTQMQSRLAQWDEAVAQLRTQGRVIDPGARAAYFGRLTDLRSVRDAGHLALGAVRVANDDNGPLLRAYMDTAWHRMSSALARVDADLHKAH